jgi:hypothetical protein
MGKYLIIAILAVCAAPVASADEWSKTYSLTGKPDLQVETSDANIHVATWDQGTIEARVSTARTRSASRAFASSSIRLATPFVRCPHEVCIVCVHMGGHVEVEIHMPSAGDVNLHSGDGHIDVDMPITTEGRIRQNEIHGKLNGGGNPLVIHTGDGSIRLAKT